MNKIIFAAFAAGAVLGVIVAWRYSVHASEEETYDEEFDDTNADADDISEESAEEEKSEVQCIVIDEVQRIVIDEGYTAEEAETKDPYVISSDEFGFFDDYEEITLTYYADDILADDQDRIIEDKESIIGRDALSRLTNTDDETVYVRNEKLKVDYEICYDYKQFAEVMDEQPEGYANG